MVMPSTIRSRRTVPGPAVAHHDGMKPEVSAFVADGPLPGEETGEEAEIDRRARQLERSHAR